MTLENCCSLSGFPYDRMAFRKYRHFVLLKMEQLSGLFSTPGAADRLTLQGKVFSRNNTIIDRNQADNENIYKPGNYEFLMYAWFFNKRWTITRVSSQVESVTIDKQTAAGIRNGRG